MGVSPFRKIRILIDSNEVINFFPYRRGKYQLESIVTRLLVRNAG